MELFRHQQALVDKALPQKCSVKDCSRNSKVFVRSNKKEGIFCKGHHWQLWKHGKILEKTRYSSQEFIIRNDWVEIILSDMRGVEVARAKIDHEDIEIAKKHKWYLHTGYAANRSGGHKGRNIFLHQLVLGIPKKGIVDHKNHNKLDNRKKNLRVVSQVENQINREGLNKNNTSGHRGISWDKARGMWQAYIKIEYKNIRLGHFYNIDDAVRARKKAEKEYWKSYGII